MEYEEVQNNEVEALKAIYGPDFKQLPVKSVWNQRPPPKFTITLRPSSDFKESPIEFTLQVEMTPTYPNTKPKIDIVKTTALSGRQTEILKASVAQTVQQMLKNEMIYEITSNLQSQVDEWARSVSEAAPSLEEDMLRRRQIEEAKQSAKQDELQRQREAAAKKEEQKYDSLILEEIKKNENAGSKRTASADTLQSLLVVPESTLGVTTFEHTISISPPFTNSPVEFRQVMDGINVPGPLIGSTYLARALLPQSQADTDLVVSLMRIGISSPFWRSSAGTRALHELNTELECIRNVHLPGVVPLSEFSIERFNGTNEEWMVNILTPYSRLTPLSVVLNSTGTISLKTTQVWALQILETLEGLHKRGMRHKCICPYSVMINSHPETGETSVLLRHPQYLFNLQKLNKEHPFSTSTSYNTIKTVKGGGLIEQLTEDSYVLLPPESQNDYGAAPSSKWDLWQLGALMTLMVSGKHELQRFNYDPELYLRSKPRQLPSVFIKFLLGMLQPDPSKRPGALELLTDEFFRTSLDRIDRVEEDSDSSFSDSTDSLPTVTSHHQHHPSQALAASIASTHTEGNPLGSFGRRRLSSNEDVMFSRYKHDFDEGIVLGKGGFGQVVKARNKLDGRVYAVKKIRATPSTLSHILQEVVLLSRLNHQYVVRYYTVWLEDEVETASTAHAPSSVSLQPSGATSVRDGRDSNAAIDYDSVSRSTLDQGASNTSVGDDIPSTSMSQFSVHHSLSELDIPSASQDFMSDSGFVEFGFSDTSDAVLDFSDNHTIACPASENQENTEMVGEAAAATAAGEEHKRRARRASSEKELINRISNITRKTLYIQMEYCENHTLGDLVRQGLYNTPQEYWRLLRQILDALAYIHGEGVIHRDLKPKNIFIDQARNIKIGDFGLARSMVQPLQSRQPSVDAFTGSQAAATVAAAINTSTTMNGYTTDYEEFTTDVGTSLYAAVEITDPAYSKRGYNEKVDIFSLGIIFFEMVWKMDTEMERIVDIRRARTAQIELPRELTGAKDKSVEVSLIRCMLDHDPSRRPSAHGLLKSGRIPVEESDMTVVEALHNMRDQRVVQQLVNALFSRPLISAQQVLYDRINISTSVQARRQKPRVGDPSGCLTMSYVEDTLRSIFQAHGAVENTLFRSRLFPRSPLYKGPTVVELVDVQGTVLQLPYDLTLPHARRLAEIVPDYKKVCAVDTVFRNRLQNVGHHPAKHIEVDFDIMSTEDSEDSLIFDEAETIGVMYDSANTVICSEDRNDLIVVIGHHDILAATLSHCGLSPPQYHAALVLLASGSLDRRNNSALARSNVSTASLDMLNQFAFRESFTRSESRMSRLMPLSERVRRGMARVKAVASTFKQLCATNREPQILFSPLVHTATSDFYINGVIFQLVDVKNLQGNARNFNAGSVLAMGGRYDSLIQSFRNTLLDNRTPLVKAVGFGMSADKLEMIMSKQQQQQSQTASRYPIPARCQVLISSLSDTSLKTQGVEAARLLWSSGISTDIAWGASSADEIVAKAQEEQIPIVVMVKQINSTTALASSNTFKPLRVKRILANTQSYGDVDLLFTELVPFIQNALGSPADSTEQAGNPSNPVQLSPFAESANDPSPDSLSKVLVINENSKLKGGRKNKWQLEEKSVEARANFLAELSNAPIISVDLRDDVIQAILNIHPAAVDDWKRRVIGLSPNQKAYILTVQSKLANEATRSPRMMLYSLKTENVFIYNY